jgi:hypothetical protein
LPKEDNATASSSVDTETVRENEWKTTRSEGLLESRMWLMGS